MLTFLFSPVGRIGRSQWWLAQVLAVFSLIIFLTLFGNPESGEKLSVVAVWLACLLFIWTMFCTSAKRYHDHNKSAWWVLVQFIPVIGPVWATFELGILPGDIGGNDYGLDPLSISKKVIV